MPGRTEWKDFRMCKIGESKCGDKDDCMARRGREMDQNERMRGLNHQGRTLGTSTIPI